MLITAFAYWGVGMPVGWWLAFRAGYGARGMWMGLIAGLAWPRCCWRTRFWRLARSHAPAAVRRESRDPHALIGYAAAGLHRATPASVRGAPRMHDAPCPRRRIRRLLRGMLGRAEFHAPAGLQPDVLRRADRVLSRRLLVAARRPSQPRTALVLDPKGSWSSSTAIDPAQRALAQPRRRRPPRKCSCATCCA